MKLSLIIPAFNEEACLPQLIERLDQCLLSSLAGHEVEVILQLDAEGHRVILRPELLEQAVAKLKDEADRAEISPGVVAVLRTRVHVRID